MKNEIVVLAVDDDMINLKLLKSMLMKTDFIKDVVEARDGSEAVNMLKQRDDIDLVLLDIIMPIMNGIEVLQVVRSDNNLKQIPIIVLTTDETKKTEAMQVGANEFLMKPIRGEDLKQKIASVFI